MNTATKTVWKIDPTHSEVQFRVKHLVISSVTGSFNQFDGSVESDDDEEFEGAVVRFEADINSISTNNADRDAHLKSDDFFNAEKFPKLLFESTSFTHKGGDSYKLDGMLTIRDVSKPVSLDVVYGGTVVDPYGQTKAGFEVSGHIDRKEFGLSWNAVTEAGNIVVGDQVRLTMNVQFIQTGE